MQYIIKALNGSLIVLPGINSNQDDNLTSAYTSSALVSTHPIEKNSIQYDGVFRNMEGQISGHTNKPNKFSSTSKEFTYLFEISKLRGGAAAGATDHHISSPSSSSSTMNVSNNNSTANGKNVSTTSLARIEFSDIDREVVSPNEISSHNHSSCSTSSFPPSSSKISTSGPGLFNEVPQTIASQPIAIPNKSNPSNNNANDIFSNAIITPSGPSSSMTPSFGMSPGPNIPPFFVPSSANFDSHSSISAIHSLSGTPTFSSTTTTLSSSLGANTLSASTQKKPKNKCHFDTCSEKAVKFIGDCRYCDGHFCPTHRLPETHQCSNIQNCRQESFDKYSCKLLSEKCIADKL